jgi:hypothetical protein
VDHAHARAAVELYPAKYPEPTIVTPKYLARERLTLDFSVSSDELVRLEIDRDWCVVVTL